MFAIIATWAFEMVSQGSEAVPVYFVAAFRMDHTQGYALGMPQAYVLHAYCMRMILHETSLRVYVGSCEVKSFSAVFLAGARGHEELW